MDQALQELVGKARTGDEESFQALVRALRAEGPSVERLIGLATSPETPLRRAAVVLSRGCTEPEVLAALAELPDDPSIWVRQELADSLHDSAWWAAEDVLKRLLADADGDVRAVAVRAAGRRPSLEPLIVERLRSDEFWRARQEAARALGRGQPQLLLPVLVTVLAEESDNDVREACAVSAEGLIVRAGGYPPGLTRPRPTLLKLARERAGQIRSGLCTRLLAWLDERLTHDVDLDGLKGFGTVLTTEADHGRLNHGFHLEDAVEAILKVLLGDGPRAVVLVGESGCGKTALVHELVYRLRDHPEGWVVLQVSPSEFLAGTTYLGEWETKLKNLIQAVCRPRRVLLYVPNLEDLAAVGTTSKSDSNVATALAPHVERGDVAILGESTVESFRRGLGAIRSLRRLFHAVQLPTASPEQTRDVLQAVAFDAGAKLSDGLLDRLMELADFYVAGAAQPGRSVSLLRRLLAAPDRAAPITERDVLATLSASSGIPVDYLDDGVPLDRARVRAFFEARVMGQPEAVDAVVDLVTLIKAGLNDPHKPFGVLLFVGPTGVGKTELARALAELLFGDATRMVRLDMSEYATYEAYERLIGHGATPGLLTATVRERPFAVLLLDEIEKAHFNVFDLCLQIFDAGRLTDSQGRTADFRRTIIILTSNVGSRIAQEAPVGFGRAVPPPPDAAVTMRELSRVFRPEFLNRIDRVVTFRPLSAETAERIAHRELARVVERSGIVRRRLTVDVEPAVVPLLLKEGYSPAYGARPLKRTVERFVLLPVARVIAGGEAPPGSVLRLVARRDRVEVEVAPPESAEPPQPAPAARAVPVAERAARLTDEVAKLREDVAPLTERKGQLLTKAAAPGLWDDRTAAQMLYDELYRIDGVLNALTGLERSSRDAAEAARFARKSDRDLARVDEQLDGLEGQARHVAFLVRCRNPRDLGDAYVSLTRINPQGTGLDGVAKLGRMYQQLAARHGLEAEAIDDHRGGDPAEDTATLLVSGAGAFALLAGEAGLHQLTRGLGPIRQGRRRPAEREVIRVEVLPVPTDEVQSGDIQVEARPLAQASGRLLARPRLEVILRHTPSLITVRAWSDRSRAEAVERLRPLLIARVRSVDAAGSAGPAVIRRYALGPAPLVRDVRSGRGTGRLEQVLDGQLDLFLVPPAT